MNTDTEFQMSLMPSLSGFPLEMERYPRFRYMGSKYRLLPWIHDQLSGLVFDSAIDAFSGSGVVSYLLKSMGKRVQSNDALAFPSVLTAATVANSETILTQEDLERVLSSKASSDSDTFIQNTFTGIFYTPQELVALDDLWAGIRLLGERSKRSMAIAALLRSAIKRQPRGLFTVGDPSRYQDGRRDLKLDIRDHFVEQVDAYNRAVFCNGRQNSSSCGDVFDLDAAYDLVYLDPPYVPLSDDNCYIKRYHFLEGLACYWEDKQVMMTSKVRKIVKPFTPFSYRNTALDAFDRLFKQFAESIQVLSYSSNAFPDLRTLTTMMQRYKKRVEVVEKEHRYHFGTHSKAKRNLVKEYLIIGL